MFFVLKMFRSDHTIDHGILIPSIWCSAYGFSCRKIAELQQKEQDKLTLLEMGLAGVCTGFVQSPVRYCVGSSFSSVVFCKRFPLQHIMYDHTQKCQSLVMRRSFLLDDYCLYLPFDRSFTLVNLRKEIFFTPNQRIVHIVKWDSVNVWICYYYHDEIIILHISVPHTFNRQVIERVKSVMQG